jgi:hypothetical protein
MPLPLPPPPCRCDAACDRADGDSHTPHALVIEERRGAHQRWKMCAHSEADLLALKEARERCVTAAWSCSDCASCLKYVLEVRVDARAR